MEYHHSKVSIILPTILNIEVDVYLLQGNAHAGTFCIGDHDKFGVGGRFVEVKFVLACGVGNKTANASVK